MPRSSGSRAVMVNTAAAGGNASLLTGDADEAGEML
jgi:delta 1-pyrroline-5-carboxylate dehydrogenase